MCSSGVRSGTEETCSRVTLDRRQACQAPRSQDGDLVPAASQSLDHVHAEALLDQDAAWRLMSPHQIARFEDVQLVDALTADPARATLTVRLIPLEY